MRPAKALATTALAAICVAAPCRAAETLPADPAPSAPETLDAGRRQLQDAMEAAGRAEADRQRDEGALDAIRADRARLATALIDVTARVRDAEARSAVVAVRLDLLASREAGIRASFAARRGEIASVLAALQRLGLHPPPALLASPDDALRAIRTAALLGAAVPALSATARALASDLAELGRLRGAIATERDALAVEAASLGAERERLAHLVKARQAAQAAAEGTLAGDRRRAAEFAGQASTLKDLVSRLESDAAASRRTEEAARAVQEADAAGVAAKAAAGTRDPARLAPAVAFADTRGRLTLPVVGRVLTAYGAPDGYGGQERGLSLGPAPGAVVTAPADGWVSFSGPYRSYGQLLIMNMGDGYYVVLAGLARADVVPGQFVLAGEPLGAMGDGSTRSAAAIALGADGPVLYVELRKDGAAIDPAPWWAKAEVQKVRG